LHVCRCMRRLTGIYLACLFDLIEIERSTSS
jgi:hypothetical protein